MVTAVLLKYLSNFSRILEMRLINCGIILILNWLPTFVIINSTGKVKFDITDTKLLVPVVTLSTEDNTELLKQSNSGFKRTFTWNKKQVRKSVVKHPIFRSLN